MKEILLFTRWCVGIILRCLIFFYFLQKWEIFVFLIWQSTNQSRTYSRTSCRNSRPSLIVLPKCELLNFSSGVSLRRPKSRSSVFHVLYGTTYARSRPVMGPFTIQTAKAMARCRRNSHILKRNTCMEIIMRRNATNGKDKTPKTPCCGIKLNKPGKRRGRSSVSSSWEVESFWMMVVDFCSMTPSSGRAKDRSIFNGWLF